MFDNQSNECLKTSLTRSLTHSLTHTYAHINIQHHTYWLVCDWLTFHMNCSNQITRPNHIEGGAQPSQFSCSNIDNSSWGWNVTLINLLYSNNLEMCVIVCVMLCPFQSHHSCDCSLSPQCLWPDLIESCTQQVMALSKIRDRWPSSQACSVVVCWQLAVVVVVHTPAVWSELWMDGIAFELEMECWSNLDMGQKLFLDLT